MNPPPSTTPSAPLGYSTPAAPAAEGSLLVAWPLTVVLTILATLVTATVLVVLPRSYDVFRDFKMELPGLTKIVFALAQTGDGYAWLAVWLLPCLPVTILALRGPTHDLAARRRTLRLWRILVTFATLAFVAVVAFAVVLPHVQLINSVSGTSRR